MRKFFEIFLLKFRKLLRVDLSFHRCRKGDWNRMRIIVAATPNDPRCNVVAGGPFSEVMVDSRGVTFIKNELFLLYSQVIIKECVYGYRSSVENGQRTYFGE